MSKTLLLAVLVACSSTAERTRSPDRPGDTGSGEHAPVANAPTERECDELFAHAIAIRIAELGPEHAPTDAEQAQLRGELHAAFVAPCRAGSRAGHACGMAAKTLAELEACQETRSSSTSNSKVAPGGMTPPAPRSP